MLTNVPELATEAEDIVQGVFIRYYEKYWLTGKHKTFDNPAAMLFIMARNDSLNVINDFKRKQKASEQELNNIPEQHEVEDILDGETCKKEILAQLMDHFPANAERDFKIIYLWCAEEMSYKEIEEELGVTTNIIEDVLRRKFKTIILPNLKKRFGAQ